MNRRKTNKDIEKYRKREKERENNSKHPLRVSF